MYRIIWKIILCAIATSAIVHNPSYSGYKIFKLIPKDQGDVNTINGFKGTYGFHFLDEPSTADKPVFIMVAPINQPFFQDIFGLMGITYQLVVEDVQEFIDEYNVTYIRRSTFDFLKYHPLKEIYQNLDELAEKYPNVQIIVGGQTYEGRQIKGVKVSFGTNNGIFLEGGIHGNEWISPATVMYILHQLLTSNNTDIRELAEGHDWYIFPVFNPDGYVYTHTVDRLWRKTVKPYNRHHSTCIGVDLDRNWAYRWSTSKHFDPCAPNYEGKGPFSEIESNSMARYIHTIANKFYAYISFRNSGQSLVFPYGWTSENITNYDTLHAIAQKAVTVLQKRYGTKYRIGSIAESLNVTSGGTLDYIFGIYNTQIVYQYHLPDSDYLFLPPEQIIPTGEETLDSLVAMFKETKAYGYPNTNCDYYELI